MNEFVSVPGRGMLATLAAATVLWAPAPVHAQAQSLGDWLRGDLEPELASQFTDHPRLRGSTVQVMAMREAQRQIPTDALSVSLVERLTQLLTTRAGTRVVPPALIDSAAACMAQDQVEYRLAIDVRGVRGGDATITVRLFDVHEGTWVGGVGGRWAGALDAGQRRKLATTVEEESARGDRALPFEAGQPDLIARAFVGQFACELARADFDRREGAGLYLEPGGAEDPRLLKSALLVQHQLATEAGWRPRTTAQDAALRLRLHEQAVDERRSLLWMTLEQLAPGSEEKDGRVLATAQTYVQGAARSAGSGGSSSNGLPALVERGGEVDRGQRPPAVDAPTPVRLPVPVTGGRVAPADRAAPAGFTGDLMAPMHSPLLSTPTVRAVACEAVGPIGRAGRPAAAGARTASVCDLVSVDVGRPATVFWLWHPASCELPAPPAGAPRVRFRETYVDRAATLTAPLSAAAPGAGGFDEVAGAGVEGASLYVIAVDAAADPSAVRRLLDRYPGDGGCASPRWPQELHRWALSLESTLLQLGDAGAWEGVRLTAADAAGPGAIRGGN